MRTQCQNAARTKKITTRFGTPDLPLAEPDQRVGKAAEIAVFRNEHDQAAPDEARGQRCDERVELELRDDQPIDQAKGEPGPDGSTEHEDVGRFGIVEDDPPGDHGREADLRADCEVDVGGEQDGQQPDRSDADDREAITYPEDVLLRGEGRRGREQEEGQRDEKDRRHHFRTRGEAKQKRVAQSDLPLARLHGPSSDDVEQGISYRRRRLCAGV